mmetsp:Transcript_19949/g.40643  ORF Transcript_19949/g.40643 Transcript_19949/m.40643 type:complete len:215 (+) Transcript_19949:1941-2585(+)
MKNLPSDGLLLTRTQIGESSRMMGALIRRNWSLDRHLPMSSSYVCSLIATPYEAENRSISVALQSGSHSQFASQIWTTRSQMHGPMSFPSSSSRGPIDDFPSGSVHGAGTIEGGCSALLHVCVGSPHGTPCPRSAGALIMTPCSSGSSCSLRFSWDSRRVISAMSTEGGTMTSVLTCRAIANSRRSASTGSVSISAKERMLTSSGSTCAAAATP